MKKPEQTKWLPRRATNDNKNTNYQLKLGGWKGRKTGSGEMKTRKLITLTNHVTLTPAYQYLDPQMCASKMFSISFVP